MNRQDMVVLTLEGLVPIVVMDLVSRGELNSGPFPVPSEEERERLVGLIATADVLVVGGGTSKKERQRAGQSLSALAKAIAYLSCAPGGVRVLGRRWEMKREPFRVETSKVT